MSTPIVGIPPLSVGSKVWYRPEPQPGTDKLAPKWRGPGTVTARVGAHSYVVEVVPGVSQEAHRSQLKPHVAEVYGGDMFPLHYFSAKAPEVAVQPDEWLVERIVRHRTDDSGSPEFLVEWKGCDPSDSTWEPWTNFFPGYNPDFLAYCAKAGIKLDLVALFDRPRPMSRGRGRPV